MLAQLMHEARAMAICSRNKRYRGNNRAGVEKNIRADGSKTLAFRAERARVFDEDRNVVIGIRFRIAARTRTEQYDTLKAVAVNFRPAARNRTRTSSICGELTVMRNVFPL